MKIGKFILKSKFDNSEPMPCMRDGCEEELNALNHFWIEIGKFRPEIWLCGPCAEEFKKQLERQL